MTVPEVNDLAWQHFSEVTIYQIPKKKCFKEKLLNFFLSTKTIGSNSKETLEVTTNYM